METQSFINSKLSHLRHLWDCSCPLRSATDKSAETREKILMAAFDEIYSYGYQSASLSNILKNTGTTKGALYHHFKNKKELGLAVLDEVICTSYRASWIEPFETTDDPITTMTELLMNSSKQMTDEDVYRGCSLNNLAQEMSPIDSDFRERIRQAYAEWQAALEHALSRGQGAGNVELALDPKEMALLLVATLGGCMGIAKNMQSLDALMCCGKGLIDRMEAARPK
uniref:TetR family transcriptional regulator n=1 Tax=uncultured Thiotrichaceae bacterium TaxID=298394 RepID=A0A6S6SP21_9GAMM|nr:MAG: TetR family transcriptional regulator [uncultured Thiotrichaceae bacterium]